MTLIDKAEALAVLRKAQVASCTCQIKTPDPEWHSHNCRYRILREAEAMIDHLPDAALPARGVGVQWQNINTAPRGGEWFIARTEHGTTRVVHFADEYDRFPISHDGVVWPTAPTEWMPLKPILAALAPTDAAQAREAATARSANRVDYNPDGTLDEIVTDAGVHLEHMGGKRWFLGAARSDGTEIRVWFDGKVTLVEDDAKEART